MLTRTRNRLKFAPYARISRMTEYFDAKIDTSVRNLHTREFQTPENWECLYPAVLRYPSIGFASEPRCQGHWSTLSDSDRYCRYLRCAKYMIAIAANKSGGRAEVRRIGAVTITVAVIPIVKNGSYYSDPVLIEAVMDSECGILAGLPCTEHEQHTIG